MRVFPGRCVALLAPSFVLLVCLCFGGRSMAYAAESSDHKALNFVSGPGTVLYLVAGVGLPLLTDGAAGRAHALRALDVLGTSFLLTEGLKALTQEKRPDSDAHDSFPSAHASVTFSIATVQSAWHPREAVYWYAGASFITASRVGLHRHTIGDVMAGAALGYGVGRLELGSRRGLLLAPFIQPERHAYGVSFAGAF